MDQSAGLMRNAGEPAAEKRSYRVHLGFGIEAVRLRRQLTRKALASRLGVTAKLLGYWERGSCRPPIEKLVELCRVLRVTAVEDLLAAGERREAYLLRRHDGPEDSERRSEMSEETNVTVPGVGVDPGIVPPEPDLKSERVQEEGVAPEPMPGPVQAD